MNADMEVARDSIQITKKFEQFVHTSSSTNAYPPFGFGFITSFFSAFAVNRSFIYGALANLQMSRTYEVGQTGSIHACAVLAKQAAKGL